METVDQKKMVSPLARLKTVPHSTRPRRAQFGVPFATQFLTPFTTPFAVPFLTKFAMLFVTLCPDSVDNKGATPFATLCFESVVVIVDR